MMSSIIVLRYNYTDKVNSVSAIVSPSAACNVSVSYIHNVISLRGTKVVSGAPGYMYTNWNRISLSQQFLNLDSFNLIWFFFGEVALDYLKYINIIH